MPRTHRFLVRATLAALAAVGLAACDNSNRPAAPSGIKVASGGGSTPTTVGGRVVASGAGEPLPNVSVDIGGRVATTDATGVFRFDEGTITTAASVPVSLTGSSIVPRTLTVGLTSPRELILDAFAPAFGFDLTYYRQLVRDTHDSPTTLRALRRWTQAPRIYIRSVDEAGRVIDPISIQHVTNTLREDVAVWTGGRLGVASTEVGAATREGQPGWITIKWPGETAGGICGRAQVAQSGGWIEFYYLNRNCGCNGQVISAGTIRHELEHARGFYHTAFREDVMWGTITCDGRPSPRERFHAGLAYTRSFGNSDPDHEPATTIQRAPDTEPIVVVD